MKNNRNVIGKRIVALMLSVIIAAGAIPVTNIVADMNRTDISAQTEPAMAGNAQAEAVATAEILWVTSEDLAQGYDVYYAQKDTIQVEVGFSNPQGEQLKAVRMYHDGKQIEEKKIGKSGKITFSVPLDKGKNAINQIYAVAVDKDGNEINDKKNMLVEGKRILYDGTTPHISFATEADVYQEDNRIYTIQNVDFNLEVTTGLSGIKNINVQVNGNSISKDKNGKTFGKISNTQSNEMSVKENYTLSMDEFTEADAYQIRIRVTNVAGKEYQKTYSVYRDTEAPKLESIVIPEIAENAGQMFSSKDGYYYFFTNKQVNAIITMTDGGHGSGVKETNCYLSDEYGKKIYEEKVSGNQAKIAIPENFKGFICAKGTDQLGNTSSYGYTMSGMVAESSKKHKEAGSIEVNMPEPDAVDEDGDGLYKENVKLKVAIEDSYSGIKNIEWKVTAPYDMKNNYEGKCEVSNSGNVSNSGWKVKETDRNLVTKMEGELNIRNNSNDILVEISMTDRAGNTSKKELILGIDKSVPKIEVNFDRQVQNGISSQDCTATIEVAERNFAEKQVVLHVQNAQGSKKTTPKVSTWKEKYNRENPNLSTHTATVTFEEDGEYTFWVTYKDTVGNVASPSSTYRFSIDRTAPEVQVNMVNNDYFTQAPTATIRIKEKNFDSEQVKITGNAKNSNQKDQKFPGISGWKKQDDTYTATVTFTADGTYNFSVTATDKAGNTAKTVSVNEFHVDQTKPEVEISGVADAKAYKDAVQPVIHIKDDNLDNNQVRVKLVGANSGEVKLDGHCEIAKTKSEQTIRLSDFAQEKMADDIYTLTAEGTDRAGNKVKKDIRFSINHLGSVYTFDDNLKKMDGTYQQKTQDVVLTETNVDELEQESIKVTLFENGVPKDLVENQDYVIEKTGGNGKWSQYNYRIDKKNFEGDGSYSIVISSRDKAGNINENDAKDKKAEISFGIDATKPVIMPVDVEESGTYAAATLKASISVADNLLLKNVKILLNGKNVDYVQDGDNYIIDVPESSARQEIYVTAEDAAGNVAEYQIKNLLVTSNAIVRWYNNKPVFWATVGIGAGIICVIVLIIGVTRKKKAGKQSVKR